MKEIRKEIKKETVKDRYRKKKNKTGPGVFM